MVTVIRPKLKGDIFYIPVADGVYFRNNHGSFKLKGKTIYRWVENIIPFLNGHYTLEEIIQGLDPERQEMVINLVQTLLTHHFLKDVSNDLPHTLSPTEIKAYAQEIAFIDSFCDSAPSRFERFREHHMLLIGSGLTLTGLVHASLKCGIRQLSVLTTKECETNTQRHRDYLDLFHKDDPRQILFEIAAPDWENETEILATLQPFDTILHISDQPMLTRARMLNRLCIANHKTFIQTTFVDDHAWIGPLVRPNTDDCWECGWRRLQANVMTTQEQNSCYAFRDHIALPLSRFIALPTAAFVANQVSFEIFKYLTEAGSLETEQSLVEIDLETLRSRKHTFMPHPLCTACHHPAPHSEETFLNTIHYLEEGKTLDQNLFSKQIAPYFDQRVGLFHSLDDDDFIQLPLSMCKAVTSAPPPFANASNLPEVIGIATTTSEALLHSAMQACEIYAASMIDQRLLLSAEMHPERTIPAERFLHHPPLTETRKWAWAYDLQNREAHLIPASLAYPVLRGRSALSEAWLGCSSGMSWAEATSQALLKVCQYLTIIQLESAQKPYPLIDLATAPLEPDGIRLYHLLEKIDVTIQVYDVTSPLQVPTFAFLLQGKTTIYTTHLDIAQALRNGMEQVIRYWQLADTGSPIANLPPQPDIPIALRGNLSLFPRYTAPQEWPDRQRRLQEILQKNSWHALVVPLDHDPALRQVQPYIVHVLLAHT